MNETCCYCEQQISSLCIVCKDCIDVKLCRQCFLLHVEPTGHKRSHNYKVQLSNDALRLFEDSDWSVTEELLLLNAIEIFGYGNWKDISTYMETRSSDDCSARFEKFLRSPCGRLLLSRYASNSARKLAAIDHTGSRGSGGCSLSLSPSSCSRFGLTPSPASSSLLTARTGSAYEPHLHVQTAISTPRPSTNVNGNAGGTTELLLDQRDSALLGFMPLCDYFEYDYDDEADELLNAIDLADDTLGVRLALASASKFGPAAGKLSQIGAKLAPPGDALPEDASLKLAPNWTKLGFRVTRDPSVSSSASANANNPSDADRHVERVRRLLQLVSIDVYQRRIRERAIRRAILAREQAHARILDYVLRAAGSCSHAAATSAAQIEEEDVVIRPRTEAATATASAPTRRSAASKRSRDASPSKAASSPKKKKQEKETTRNRIGEALKSARTASDWRSVQSKIYNRLAVFARFSKPPERARLATAITRINWLKRRINAMLSGFTDERDALAEPPTFEPPKVATRRVATSSSSHVGGASPTVAAADAIRRKRRRHKHCDGFLFERKRKKPRYFKTLFAASASASDRE